MLRINQMKSRCIIRVLAQLSSVSLVILVLIGCAPTKTAGDRRANQQIAHPYEIQLQSRIFTPKPSVPQDLGDQIKRLIAMTDTVVTRAPVPRLHILVQLQSPPVLEDREGLARQGITLLTPLTSYTWYAAVTIAGAENLSREADVRWAGLIIPGDKLAQGVQPGAPVLPYHKRPGGRMAYSILFHSDVDAGEVQVLPDRLDIRLEDFNAQAFPVVRAIIVNIPEGQLDTLANLDNILWIEPAPPPDENNNLLNAQPLSNVDNVQAVPFGLDGAGVAVGVWEAGTVVYAAHLDLTPRVTIEAGQTATIGGHATHVAGTIGASGVNVANAEGMAPNVNLASWDSGGDTGEMTNAVNSAGGAGQPTPIQISNHSYGTGIGWDDQGADFTDNQDNFGEYTNRTWNYDNVVAQTGLIIVKAAGNHRNDAPAAADPAQPNDCFQGGLGVAADCIGPRSTAKNIITVGAMNGAGAISVFSSYGPTDDGRIKPDLMAQGSSVFSLAATATDASTIMSGTSMAAPVMTGIAALVLQDANRMSITMTPAMMKALLIQTAQDVQGIGQSTVGPDYATGWGIGDAEAAINLLRQSGVDQGTLAGTGIANAWTSTFYVPAGLAEMHITLVWDDPPGIVGGQILTNDLDLRLIAPNAAQFAPWTLNPLTPGVAAVRNGGNDAVNNIEQASVLTPMPGIWTVQVSSGNLPQAPQTFAVAGALPQSDVMLVMDRSGSMSLTSSTGGVTKLEALQNASNEFVDLLDLGGGHRLGLVQFEEDLVPFAPPFDLQLLAAGNVADAHTAINSMVTGGLTNIIAGVNEGASQLGGIVPPFPRQAIVVFSDGKHNRPVGSDLNDIDATVQAGNYNFYSIGFGTDVNDAILSSIADNSGGIHVNEQDLSSLQLTKYFLTVGALVHNMAVLADPRYEIGAGESAELSTNVARLDQSVTFAVNWTGNYAPDVNLTLEGPDGGCRIPLSDHEGLQIRKGATYRLIRVNLPYDCDGMKLHEGSWTIRAAVDSTLGEGKETVDLMILADSRLNLVANSMLDEKMGRFILTARFLQDGLPLRKGRKRSMEAHILLPLAGTNDSEVQDSLGVSVDSVKYKRVARKDRLKTLRLYDNGKNGDQKARDGVFTAALDVSGLEPGLLQARIVATTRYGRLTLRREATSSLYIKK